MFKKLLLCFSLSFIYVGNVSASALDSINRPVFISYSMGKREVIYNKNFDIPGMMDAWLRANEALVGIVEDVTLLDNNEYNRPKTFAQYTREDARLLIADVERFFRLEAILNQHKEAYSNVFRQSNSGVVTYFQCCKNIILNYKEMYRDGCTELRELLTQEEMEPLVKFTETPSSF